LWIDILTLAFSATCRMPANSPSRDGRAKRKRLLIFSRLERFSQSHYTAIFAAVAR
jgi:hypothetical protein